MIAKLAGRMANRPNILWIVTTQWRAQATGYAGGPNARTPCLDALAARSVNYVQAVTPHPFGPFARAAMLTGVPSPENGVREYFDPLPADKRTIAHELNDCGYATAFFGKWHLAPRDPAAPLVGEAHAQTFVPVERRGGFEFWEGFESGFLLNDPWLHGTRLAQPTRFTGYQSEVLCARAANWLCQQIRNPKSEIRNKARPWFCVVSLEPPHPPYDAPAAGVPPRAPSEIILPANVPLGGEEEAIARRELAGYYSHIEATDRAIGRLIDAVDRPQAEARRAGLARRGGDSALPPAIIVFTSVHGDMHGAHGLFRKGWPYEESVRVPLLVRSAESEKQQKTETGKRKPESLTTDACVSLLDLPRWTRAWAEGRQPKTQDAKFKTEIQRISMPSVVQLPHQCDRVWRGVRTAKRKLILNIDGSPWLFFDIANDPSEMRNLAHDPAWADELTTLRKQV
ncbi:MAG TPA: sulfatase-like hydrolase/transferase [Opitutaceae bacterium]|nr:sulfatase-like hydrolase/transferase [Opitutaceae bacterium]